ncbi:Hypothetical_protein [Hexamita inflata]|uniref:Hypothetical_protein n=1 Tax=Hexamita inflata TaxID=28002 RepID=A0AA86QZ03_9EUKA|nr:Hypothetical protein HINF_LOCUS50153 [Hexamita inflata]
MTQNAELTACSADQTLPELSCICDNGIIHSSSSSLNDCQEQETYYEYIVAGGALLALLFITVFVFRSSRRQKQRNQKASIVVCTTIGAERIEGIQSSILDKHQIDDENLTPVDTE